MGFLLQCKTFFIPLFVHMFQFLRAHSNLWLLQGVNVSRSRGSIINPSGWEVRELVPLHAIFLSLFLLVLLTLPPLLLGIWKVSHHHQSKMTSSKKMTCKGIFLKLIRAYKLEIKSVMLVFSTQLCELLPLSPSLWLALPPSPLSLCG
jgi:hypothetical protein